MIPPESKRRIAKLRWVTLTIALAVLGSSAQTASALNFSPGGDWHVMVNGYADFEYTKMTRMPMFMPMMGGMMTNPAMGGMFMKMEPQRQLAQRHSNLLVDAQRGRFRVHLNFESLNTLTTEDRDIHPYKNHLLQSFGEYMVSEGLSVRVGQFLAPFGIFNDIRYITPLFATVVLPFIYMAPGNYSGTLITPPLASAMISGQYYGDTWGLYYAAYTGMEDKDRTRLDKHDLGNSVGARVKLSLFDDAATLGFSAYTVKDQTTRKTVPSSNGMGFQRMAVNNSREVTWGIDLDALPLPNLLPGLRLQGEYVRSDFEGARNRSSYYVRLMYEIDRFTPFIMFDSLDDPADPLYRAEHKRFGIGAGVRLTNHLYLKGEYHLHWFVDEDRLQAAMGMNPKPVDGGSQMFRTSLIFAF